MEFEGCVAPEIRWVRYQIATHLTVKFIARGKLTFVDRVEDYRVVVMHKNNSWTGESRAEDIGFKVYG